MNETTDRNNMNTKSNATDLVKWDVISFRRSNESRTKQGLVKSIEINTDILGEQIVQGVVEVNGKNQLVNFNSSIQWVYRYNLGLAAQIENFA